MNTSKKWMVSLHDEKHAWVKDLADELKPDVSGSDIIEIAIERAMADKEFRTSLIEARAKIKLDTLMAKKSTLEDEIRALRQVTNGRGVRVPA